jgi:hypothetical protein
MLSQKIRGERGRFDQTHFDNEKQKLITQIANFVKEIKKQQNQGNVNAEYSELIKDMHELIDTGFLILMKNKSINKLITDIFKQANEIFQTK